MANQTNITNPLKVCVVFDWKEGITMGSGPSYVLTTRIGSLAVGHEIHLFSDPRGFYNGNDSQLTFYSDLSAAKAGTERQVLLDMNADFSSKLYQSITHHPSPTDKPPHTA